MAGNCVRVGSGRMEDDELRETSGACVSLEESTKSIQTLLENLRGIVTIY